jgi:hypothetical protein
VVHEQSAAHTTTIVRLRLSNARWLAKYQNDGISGLLEHKLRLGQVTPYHRTQETEIVALWLREYADLELLQVFPFKKGLAVLRFRE